jgi:hypothetical protein
VLAGRACSLSFPAAAGCGRPTRQLHPGHPHAANNRVRQDPEVRQRGPSARGSTSSPTAPWATGLGGGPGREGAQPGLTQAPSPSSARLLPEVRWVDLERGPAKGLRIEKCRRSSATIAFVRPLDPAPEVI